MEITENHYERFKEIFADLAAAGQVVKGTLLETKGVKYHYQLKSSLLRKGNGPRIFHHGRRTAHVLVLTHGLSDSPRYVQDIGKCFYDHGVNVIMPLLPGHGLIDPQKAFEDEHLDSYWRKTIDDTVNLAKDFGKTISLGGFSTGGTLSYNKILRNLREGIKEISGGLFLFAAAIQLPKWDTFLLNISPHFLVKYIDDELQGEGLDPYKYPILPKFGAMELEDIIGQNDELSKGKKITQPVFAAHFLTDTRTKLQGVLDLLKKHAYIGSAFIIGQKVESIKIKGNEDGEEEMVLDNVAHPSLPLKSSIPLKDKLGEITPNPQFDLMMKAAINFFEKYVTQYV